MRNRKSLCRALLALTLLFPAGALAQGNSLNTYSPYTLYGLGNLNYTGSTSFAAMGGASIGFRNAATEMIGSLRLNVTNPASLSGLPQKTIVFDLGITGSNVYLRQNAAAIGETGTLRSSYNTFNLGHVSMGIPITRGVGLAFSISPYSAVGYRVKQDDLSNLADLGVVRQTYNGEGEVNEAKLGAGWEPFKNFSIGAEIIYLFGNISRNYNATILDYTGSGTYWDVSGNTSENVSRLFGGFGLQYSPLNKGMNRLTIGATYRLGGKLNSTVTDYIPSNNIYYDIVRYKLSTSATHIPQTIGAGVYYHRPTFAIGFDYVYQDWGRHNTFNELDKVGYVDTHTYKFGAQYTPSRYNIRSFFKRVTYRVGARYNDYYLQFDGQRMNEKAVTFGVEIPFKMLKVSSVNVGVELGERGTLNNNLIRERYFKVNVGVLLFGRDYDDWFEKYKYH